MSSRIQTRERRPFAAALARQASRDTVRHVVEEPLPGAITQLLRNVQAGQTGSEEELYRLVYDELRRRARLHRSSADSLNPTTLVHETYLKLMHGGRPDWRDRRHFLAVASLAMRQILVDHARRSHANKRTFRRAELDPDDVIGHLPPERAVTDVLAVDEALAKLQQIDPTLAELVTLHWFGGQPLEECAATLDVSVRTARRYWNTARDWLRRELGR